MGGWGGVGLRVSNLSIVEILDLLSSAMLGRLWHAVVPQDAGLLLRNLN